ncbi:hypothetical protein D918_04915 [Trichuris suis]|nr:hypothetical protein D918_04915 [Trichuris suis]
MRKRQQQRQQRQKQGQSALRDHHNPAEERTHLLVLRRQLSQREKV